MRALVADDDSMNREILSRMLAHIGWECVTVEDGERAAACALAGGFDVVLLDLLMPGVDGFGAVRRIRAAGSPIPLIAVSGSDEGKAALEAAGFDGCLRKPFTMDGLREALEGIGRR
jgi:two-component system OmpR family response regulator